MPLPKSFSIAARATEAYAEAWSVVLHECWGLEPARDEPLPLLTQLLPFLRQLLTCCACAGLLEDAMVSLSCGHCYCCKCQYETPLLKIQCRQCKERTGLVTETQLRLVVECYRHMCHVLADYLAGDPSSTVKSGEFTLAKGKETPEGFDPVGEILDEVLEGKKVSRLVLFVLPPAKYLNPKPPPDPPTPKKDQISPGGQSRRDPPAHYDRETENMERDTEDSDIATQDEESVSIPPAKASSKKHKKKEKHRTNEGIALPAQHLARLEGGHATMDFHSDIEFTTARPESQAGETSIFLHKDLLEKRETVEWEVSEEDEELQIEKECLDENFVTSTDSGFKMREDLSPSLFPPKSVSLTSSHNLFLNWKHSTKPHALTALTPRARFKRLQPKCKSPYLYVSPHDSHQKKKHKSSHPTPNTLGTSLIKTPEIKLLPCAPSPTSTPPPTKKKKRSPTTPGHWRCRCGTNNPQTFDRICARGKCPCYFKNIPCMNCLCRHCKNPFNQSSAL